MSAAGAQTRARSASRKREVYVREPTREADAVSVQDVERTPVHRLRTAGYQDLLKCVGVGKR